MWLIYNTKFDLGFSNPIASGIHLPLTYYGELRSALKSSPAPSSYRPYSARKLRCQRLDRVVNLAVHDPLLIFPPSDPTSGARNRAYTFRVQPQQFVRDATARARNEISYSSLKALFQAHT